MSKSQENASSEPKNCVQLGNEVSARLQAYANRHHLSQSEAAECLLDEVLRTREFPGLYFGWTPSGEREPLIIGSAGMTLWHVYKLASDPDPQMRYLLLNQSHLTKEMYRLARAYHKRYSHEKPDVEEKRKYTIGEDHKWKWSGSCLKH